MTRRKFMHQITPATDTYSKKSKEWLRNILYTEIKEVFVGALRAIETRLGTGFDGYMGLRSEILRIGNDAIRRTHTVLDHINVEHIPQVIKIGNSKGKEEINGNKA